MGASCSLSDASIFPSSPQVFALKALPEKYSCVDMFAGQAAISRAFRARNLNVATLDIKIDRRDESLI